MQTPASFRLWRSLICYIPAIFVFASGASIATAQPPVAIGQVVEVTPGVTVLLPSPWFLAEGTKNTAEIVYPLQGENRKSKFTAGEEPRSGEDLITAAARMTIEWQQYPDHNNALKRLGQIASETSERPSLIVVAGWPAVERRRTAPLPNPGEAQAPPPLTQLAVYATTAIAADALLIRFETVIAPDADPKLANIAFEIASSVHLKPGNAQTARRDLGVILRSIVSPPSRRTKRSLRAPEQRQRRSQPRRRPAPGWPPSLPTAGVANWRLPSLTMDSTWS